MRIKHPFIRYCFNLFTGISFFLSALLTTVFIILFYYGRGLPDHTALEHYDPILSNRFYLNGSDIWRDYATEKRFYTPIEVMPDLLVKAFLVAEDKNFYIHPGLDLVGVLRAFIKNTLMGKWKTRPMGASTITQQVAKNFLLGNERSLDRKIKEAIMAIRIEKAFSKKRILELYLNQIYLGSGCYGVMAAAEHYFNKRLDELSVEEIAYLASLPKAPEVYQIHKNPEQSKARRDWVLDQLYGEKYITGQALILGKNTPIGTIRGTKTRTEDFDGAFFLEAARQKLIETIGHKAYAKGGYFAWTTIDQKMQALAHETLVHGLETYDKRFGYRGAFAHFDEAQMAEAQAHMAKQPIPLPKHLQYAVITAVHSTHVVIETNDRVEGKITIDNLRWARKALPHHAIGPEITRCSDVLSVGDVIIVRPIKDNDYTLCQLPEVTGGIVVMDAKTGRVLALSGGYNFHHNQFNNATQAMRQPGSAFKPFVYLAALERGYTKDTLILDAPLTINLGFRMKNGSTVYSPKNYTKRYYGPTSLENGLAYSRNVMTVRLAMLMGMRPVQKLVKRFGLYEKLPRQLAMALGAGETTLLRLTTAYAMMANGGYRVNATLFDRIEDREGSPIYQHTPHSYGEEERVVKEAPLQTLKNMLAQVILKGTGRSALYPICEKHHVQIYGKTGTTNEYKDAWFVGFMGRLVVGIFVGYPTPKSLGEGQTGGKVAAPIAAYFFERYVSGLRENVGYEVLNHS